MIAISINIGHPEIKKKYIQRLSQYVDIQDYIKNAFLSKNPFLKLFIFRLLMNSPVINGVIYGLMGTGKTNLLKYIMRDLNQTMGDLWEIRFVQVAELDTINKAVTEKLDPGKRFLFTTFDDFSYIIRGALSNFETEHLALTTKIRHLTGARWVIMLYSVHDVKALAPFLRTSWFSIFMMMPNNLQKRLISEFGYKRSTLSEFAFMRSYRQDVALLCDNLTSDCTIVENIPLVTEDLSAKVYGKTLEEYAEEILARKANENKVVAARQVVNHFRTTIARLLFSGYLEIRENKIGFTTISNGMPKFVSLITLDKAIEFDLLPAQVASSLNSVSQVLQSSQHDNSNGASNQSVESPE